MPTSKEFINGFDFDDISSQQKRKSTFDKSAVIEDADKSCHNCKHAKHAFSDRKKGTTYECSETKYWFKDYWKETIAKDCEHFKSNI